MDAERVSAYLERIGATPPDEPGVAALTGLMERHLVSLPFENLSVHLSEPIPTDADGIVDKLVRRRRGGICYELNGGFALLLEALGYAVTRLAARGDVGGVLGPPFDHETLLVAVAGRRLLVDVGFGRFSRTPLDLDSSEEQHDADGVYTLRPAPEGDVDVHRDGALQFRIEMRPREQEDFTPTFWWHSHSPASPFTQSLTCSLPLADGGRLTLSGDRLIHTDRDGGRAEERLPPGDLVAAYRDRFGMELDHAPAVLHPRVDAS